MSSDEELHDIDESGLGYSIGEGQDGKRRKILRYVFSFTGYDMFLHGLHFNTDVSSFQTAAVPPTRA